MGRNRTLGSPLEQFVRTASFLTEPHIDLYLINAPDAGPAVTVTLDPNAFRGDRVEIVDFAGNAMTLPIVVAASAGQTIVGFGASLLIEVNYGGVVLTFDHLSNAWLATLNCCGTAETESFVQGGNSFGEAAVLGTKDDHPLMFLVNNVQSLELLQSSPGVTLLSVPAPNTVLTLEAPLAVRISNQLQLTSSLVENTGNPIVTTATYTVDSGSTPDLNILTDSTHTAITITLPLAPLKGRMLTILDATGQAATNNVTVAGNGQDINGAATQTIGTNYATLQLLYSGTQWLIAAQSSP